MREIEFRAWQKYHKKMLKVFSIKFADNETRRVIEIGTISPQGAIPKYIYYHENSNNFKLFNENNEPILTLMQYSGLKDKNGVKIYEGDIVLCCSGECYHGVWEYSKTFAVEYGWTQSMWDMAQSDYVEIIGNIYENPELLEIV